MPKRSRSRTPMKSKPKKIRRIGIRLKRMTRARGSAGYRFSRWLISQQAGNMTVVGGTYTPVSSVFAFNTGTPGTPSELNVGQMFTFDSLPSTTEFSNLFDQYCIKRIIIQLKLTNVPENAAAPNTNVANYSNFYPTVWWVHDKDDSASYTLAQIKEVQGVKHRVLYPNRELTMSFSPTILTQLYRTSITTGYSPKANTWIDIGQTNVPHYSNKFVVDLEGLALASGGAGPQIKMNIRYQFGCKGVR